MKNRFIFSDVDASTVSEDTAFELVRTGMQYTDHYGDFAFSKEQLEDMATNFNAGIAGQEIPVDVNHDPDRRAYAWIKPNSMYVAPSTLVPTEYSLYACLYRLTPEGAHFLSTGAFRYFSIEFQRKVTRWIDNAKKTFANVIVGLAITNRPAVKNLAPTFNEIPLTENTMLTKLLSALKDRAIVSKDDKELLTALLSDLPEDELAEVQADVDAIQGKPEEEEKEPEEAKEEEPTEEPTEDKAPDEAVLSENVKLKEAHEALSKELSELRKEKEEQAIATTFSELLLSDGKDYGFVSTQKETVCNFLRTLSADQRAVFSSLMQDIKSVDFAEHGSAFADVAEGDVAEKQAMELADKYHQEGMPKHEAIAKAYIELKMV